MNGKTVFKFAAVAAAIVCVSTARVYAVATITLGADDTNFFATATGTYLKDGSLVEMGQFSANDATLQALAAGNTLTPASYATLLADFIPLNGVFSHFIGDGTSAVAGDKNSGAIFAIFSGNNAAFASGSIYTMVFNSNTTGNATQVGVFKGTSADWLFPANMNTGSAGPDTDQASQSPLIGTFSGGQPGAGNPYNGVDGNANGLVGQLRLDTIVTVPEPSTYLLVGTGLLGLLGLRRRS